MKRAKLLTISMVMVLTVSVLAVAVNLPDEKQESSDVDLSYKYPGKEIVLARNRSADKSELRDLGVEPVFDSTYGLYVSGTEQDIDNLTAEYRVRELHNRTTLSINRWHVYDFVDEEPDLNESLMIDGYEEGEKGLYIVHFVGELSRETESVLWDLGCRRVAGLDNYAKVVLMNSSLEDDVISQDFVDWVGYYHPGFKLNPYLDQGEIIIDIRGFKDREAVNDTVDEIRKYADVDDVQKVDLFEFIYEYNVYASIDSTSDLHEIAKIPAVFSIHDKPKREPK